MEGPPIFRFSYHCLKRQNELRVNIMEKQRSVKLTLIDGKAEIFGTNMLLHQAYEFEYPEHASISVFSWEGCNLRLAGNPKYVETVRNGVSLLMEFYHYVQADLQEQRCIAQEANTKGPVTLVVGPNDVGKSTVCQILLNYAAKIKFRPIFVDLDLNLGQSIASFPGSVGILPVNKPADIIKGFEVTAAKVYHFGYKSPSFNLALYLVLLKHLANVIKTDLAAASPIVRSSGVIINTCGWVESDGYDILTDTAKAFEVDRIIVIGDKPLQQKLRKVMPASVKVNYQPKSSGVVERTKLFRIQSCEAKLLNYFYGKKFSDYMITVPFSDVRIYTVPEEHVSDDIKIDCLSVDIKTIKIQPVALSTGLKEQVLAMMKVPKSVETVPEDLVTTEVIGFVMILDVNLKAQFIQFKCPDFKSLPTKYFLMGGKKFDEYTTVE